MSYLAASLTYCILVFFTTRYQYLALFYTRCAFFTLKWMPIPIIVIWTIALNITNWRAIFHYCFLLISTGCSTATTCSIFILFGIVCAWTARRALCVISWRLAFFAHKVACRTKIAATSSNWWTKLSCRTTQSTNQATCRKTLKKNAKKYIVSVNAKWGTPILPSFRSEVGYPASRGHIFQVWSARRAKSSLWRQLKPRNVASALRVDIGTHEPPHRESSPLEEARENVV